MANIDNELNKIKNAVYGKEVRGSIHDGIDKINKEVESTTDLSKDTERRQSSVEQQFDNLQQNYTEDSPSDAEIVAARTNTDTNKNYPTVGRRLDEENKKVTEQLAETTNHFKDLDTNKSVYVSNPSPALSSGKKERKFIVSFVVDDCPKNDLTRFLPTAQEKEFPFGIGVITDEVGKTTSRGEMMDWDDIAYVVKNGGQVMAHSHKHRDSTTLTLDELEEDFSTNKRVLNEKGYIADGFIFPYNASNSDSLKVVSKYFKYSFTKTGASTQGQGQNFPIFDNRIIGRNALGSYYDAPEDGFPSDTTTFEYYKSRVDWSKENSNWLVWVLHTHGDNFSEQQQQQHLRDIVDYIRSVGGEIVSPREGFERYGNLIQIGSPTDQGSFVVNSNGDAAYTNYNLTIKEGWTGKVTYSKNILGQVNITGKIIIGTGTTKYQEVGTLPGGYRPIVLTPFTFITNTNSYIGGFVDKNGDVYIREPGIDSLQEGRVLEFNFTFQSRAGSF